MQVGDTLGMTAAQLSDLYYTLLLKATGCSSNAARLWELYGGDERLVKHDYKTVDAQSVLALGRFLLEHTGPGEPLRRRVQRLFNVVRHGDELASELIQTRCERGANIARQLGFGPAVAEGVYALDEHWNGKGRPSALKGEAIPLNARIALLAQVVDVFNVVGGPIAARAEIRRRSGTWFDPKLVDAFVAASSQDTFWTGLEAGGLEARVAKLEPIACAVIIDEDQLDIIAEAFADIIERKAPSHQATAAGSPATPTPSPGTCASATATAAGSAGPPCSTISASLVSAPAYWTSQASWTRPSGRQ